MRKNRDKRTMQMALDYVAYMFVGSYFSKTVCSTTWQEKKLYMRYQELRKEEQYLLEDACIHYVENTLKWFVPDYVWEKKMSVYLVSDIGRTETEIIFKNPFYTLKITTHIKGNQPVFQHEFSCDESCRKFVMEACGEKLSEKIKHEKYAS